MTSLGEQALVGGLRHLQKMQEAISHNLANAASPGFKRRTVTAEAIGTRFVDALDAQAPQSRPELRYTERIDWSAGTFAPTADHHHVAVEGDAFLAVRDEAGRTMLTRSGTLAVDARGTLRLSSGEAVLSDSGATIQLDGRQAGKFAIDPDGTVRGANLRAGDLADQTPVGRIGLFHHAAGNEQLRDLGRGLFQPELESAIRPAAPEDARLRQGYLEQSNVDALTEMVRMIGVQRGFQAQTKALTTVHSMRGEFATAFDR